MSLVNFRYILVYLITNSKKKLTIDCQYNYKQKGKIMEEIKTRHQTPGRMKIISAMRALLESYDFSSIKIADIAKTAGVTEPLIYKYFRDKRDILHQLLQEYLEGALIQLKDGVKNVEGTINRLRALIRIYIHAYNIDRVIARIVLLEVGNSYEYYQSKSFQILKEYGNVVLSVIEDGVKNGELRNDVPPIFMRHLFFGCIDRACLHPVVFSKTIDEEILVEQLSALIIDAVAKK